MDENTKKELTALLEDLDAGDVFEARVQLALMRREKRRLEDLFESLAGMWPFLTIAKEAIEDAQRAHARVADLQLQPKKETPRG